MTQIEATAPARDVATAGDPRVDHVGVLVRDLEAAAKAWTSRFRADVARRVEAPALGISAVFLFTSGTSVELYTLHDAAALERSLGARRARLDHIALRLPSADGPVLTGCRLRGPGRPDPIESPVVIGGDSNVWIDPRDIGVVLQIITPADDFT